MDHCNRLKSVMTPGAQHPSPESQARPQFHHRRLSMNLPFHRLALVAATLGALALTGCTLNVDSAPATPIASSIGAIQGKAQGGSQAIVGAKVYVYAAATSGYGAASTLLSATPATTDGNGGFNITASYTCTSGQQVYLYTSGGNTGSGTNTAASLMAILGTCPATGTLALTTPFIFVDEVSTVAAAYAFSGFAVDATHVADDEAVTGNTTQTLAQTGMANAFANAANLVNVATGTALTATPATGSAGGRATGADQHHCGTSSPPASTPRPRLRRRLETAPRCSPTPPRTANHRRHQAHRYRHRGHQHCAPSRGQRHGALRPSRNKPALPAHRRHYPDRLHDLHPLPPSARRAASASRLTGSATSSPRTAAAAWCTSSRPRASSPAPPSPPRATSLSIRATTSGSRPSPLPPPATTPSPSSPTHWERAPRTPHTTPEPRHPCSASTPFPSPPTAACGFPA